MVPVDIKHQGKRKRKEKEKKRGRNVILLSLDLFNADMSTERRGKRIENWGWVGRGEWGEMGDRIRHIIYNINSSK